ncbi:MAG TPA: hypothetical protein PLT82_12720 [Candidatus Hydrogenedens sp.]|nr:hypothetical protein [Candidatus Hydrogenedens sp.]HOL21168.1 hypothetical protein [Candidatus Hydrogenedens sp.]HPP59985.1 hypothetical protein [Candidatus Hydrogenedens sp.]
MLWLFLEAVEAFVNAIFKAVSDFLFILGIPVDLKPIDIGNQR